MEWTWTVTSAFVSIHAWRSTALEHGRWRDAPPCLLRTEGEPPSSACLQGPGGVAAVGELGASIITGVDGNPAAIIATQLGIPMATIRTHTPIYLEGGVEANKTLDEKVSGDSQRLSSDGESPLPGMPGTILEPDWWWVSVPGEDRRVGRQLSMPSTHAMWDMHSLFHPHSDPHTLSTPKVEAHHNFLLDECHQIRERLAAAGGDQPLGQTLEALWTEHLPRLGLASAADLAQARQLFEWHLANLEFANSERLDSLSLRHWDQDDPNELPGAHTFVPGGNARWVRELARDLVIYYDSPARAVHYGARGVEVHTPRHTFRADAAVVTVPLGCLKAGDVEFRPALTPRKLGAVARINFGTLNKVVLLFPHAFWGGELDMFGRATPSPDHRGDSFLFYSSDVLSGGAVLVALVAGASMGPPKGGGPTYMGAWLIINMVPRVLNIKHSLTSPGIPPPQPCSRASNPHSKSLPHRCRRS